MDETKYRKLLTPRIDEVLYYVWDPIGVSDTPEARDEYSSYVGDIVQAVVGDHSKDDIAALLTAISIERMGLQPNKKRDSEVAELVLNWAQALKEDQQ